MVDDNELFVYSNGETPEEEAMIDRLYGSDDLELVDLLGEEGWNLRNSNIPADELDSIAEIAALVKKGIRPEVAEDIVYGNYDESDDELA